MSDENNNYVSSSSERKTSLLPDEVREILETGIRKGFRNGCLELAFRNIDDSMMPEFCEWLKRIEGKVVSLNLWKNQITSVGASMLFDTLRANNSTITDIYLYCILTIDDKCMRSFGEYIKSNKSIKVVELNQTEISDAGIEVLEPYLDGNITLKRLNFISNKGISDKSIPYLLKMIETSKIEDIGINFTSITKMNIVLMSLASNRIKNSLKKLEFDGKGLNDNDLIKICDAMKTYGIDKLKEINFEQNNITSKGASLLFDTLKECKSVISKLNMCHNNLDDECMKQLGEYMQENEHLEELRVSYNPITDTGIEILSEYLFGNTKLKDFYLRGNKGISDVSIPDLVEVVKKSNIITIVVESTSISTKSLKDLKIALCTPCNQRETPIKSSSKSAAKIQS